MSANKRKEPLPAIKKEPHNTAAWANTESLKPSSRVARPHWSEVLNAKEWVDENEK